MEKGRVLKKLKKVLIAMICTIVVVFSMPIKSKATIPEDIVDVLLKIPDGIMWLGNVFLSGRASSEASEKINLKGMHFGKADEGHIYNFNITPYDIFCNGRIRTEKDATGRVYQYKVLPIFNANFFKDTSNQHLVNDNSKSLTSGYKSSEGYTTISANDSEDSVDILRPAISNVYKFLRNLAIVVMMLVLMYIGIRIIISSAATEQSKYKQMLIDWIVGLCLLFVMHYIMSFIMNVTDIIIDMLVADETQAYYIGFDELGAAEGAWGGHGEEWYEFFDDYHDTNFINSHLALRAENDAGGVIPEKNDGAILRELKHAVTFLVKPFGYTSEAGFQSKYFESYYDWEDWESKLRLSDNKIGYSTSGEEYIKGEDYEITRQALYHRTYDENGKLVIATAKDRVIHLGKTRSFWGKNGDVTLNAIITQNKENKEGKISWYRHLCIYRGNILEYTRTISSFGRKYVHIYDDNSSTGFTSENDSFMFSAGNAILYVGLVLETIMFVFIYFKRLLQLSFLTMIAPMVAFMYPLDKVGDGKAQAFNTWFKDYLFTALLQPFHLLLYTVFITAAIDLTQKNIIYALAVYAFMIPAEKYFKKILGFEKSSAASGSGLAGAAGGLLAMRGFDRLAGLGPHGRGKGGSDSKRTKIRIPRRPTSGGGSGGGAPTSSGDGSGFRRRPLGGMSGDSNGRDASTTRGTRRRSLDGGAPNASGDGPGRGLFPNARRAIRGAISRKLTGGQYDSLRGLKNDQIRRAILGTAGSALGRGALKNAGRVAGGAVGLAAGTTVGAITAITTGDASNIFKGALTGTAAGISRGGQFGGNIASGIGNLAQDARAFRAATDEEYADRINGEDSVKQFIDNGFELNDKESSVAYEAGKYKDLQGNGDYLEGAMIAFDQEREAELQRRNEMSDDDIKVAHPEWAEKSDEEINNLIEDYRSDVSDGEIALGAMKRYSKAKSFPDLQVDANRRSYMEAALREKGIKRPKEEPEVTQADIDARASSVDDSVARAAAEKERDAKVDAIQERIEALDETYDSRIEKANQRGDTARAGELERARENKRRELERQKAQQEAAALDLEAKRKEIAKQTLEAERKARMEAAAKEYREKRAAALPDIEAELEKTFAIQKKVKK